MVLRQSPEALDTIVLFTKEESLLARQLLLMVLIVSSELVLTRPWWEELQKYRFSWQEVYSFPKSVRFLQDLELD